LKLKNTPILLLLTLICALCACTTNQSTGKAKLLHSNVIKCSNTQFKYVTGETKPTPDINHYVSTTAKYARETLMFQILKENVGKDKAYQLARQAEKEEIDIEELSKIKMDKIILIKHKFNKQSYWVTDITTKISIQLSTGKTQQITYKTRVELASSIISKTPITKISSFEIL
jgi:hypothetical protein